MSYFKDITGQRFGRLVALSRSGVTKQGSLIWLCVCDCGNQKNVSSPALSQKTKSCGCLSREKKAERVAKYRYKHGHTIDKKVSKTYQTWSGMISRCGYVKRSNYKYYGGLGVVVCERWKEFHNFLEDMGERPEGMTLDRIDPLGDYDPINCRWADKYTQANNKRPKRTAVDGNTKYLIEKPAEAGV